MNPSSSSSIIEVLFLFLSIIASTYVPTFASAQNLNFTACNQTFQCGKLTNITYPFYDGDTRPDYCGYPGFRIQCVDNNTTLQINISSESEPYRLLGINASAATLTVARNDVFSSTSGCPSRAANTTINPSLFNFTSADENITFFYGCPQGEGSWPFATCDLAGYGEETSYFLTPEMLMGNGSVLWGICKTSLYLPVLSKWAQAVEQNMRAAAIVDAFENGFELGWIAGDGSLCQRCKNSGGLCGYDSDADKFVCHCSDQDYYEERVCGGGGKSDRKAIIGIGVGVGVGVAALLIGGWSLIVRRRRKNRALQPNEAHPNLSPYSSSTEAGLLSSNNNNNNPNSSQGGFTSTTNSSSSDYYTSSKSALDIEKGSCYFGVRVFSYAELERATDNFAEGRELGDGGFGTVYYGQLPDGQPVAIKRLYENSFKRVEQFMNEIEILAGLRHDHLVTLYGCTSRRSRDLILVYEYVPNGTVADHIHGKRSTASSSSFLSWPVRINIAIQTADALHYLHRKEVVHRDVKTPNILLDSNFQVKVADFGLSRLFPGNVTHVSTLPQGTPGYVDPDYYQCYRLTDKSDVYSFGVVLMELVSSKQAVDISRDRLDINLANMALDRISGGAIGELVDPRFGFEVDPVVKKEVTVVAELAFRCLQQDREVRPSMEEVLEGLRGLRKSTEVSLTASNLQERLG